MRRIVRLLFMNAVILGMSVVSAMAQRQPIKVGNVDSRIPFKTTGRSNTPRPKAERGMYNGHQDADLGLSVKWATSNIDANNAGGYYGRVVAWGEIYEKKTYTTQNSQEYNYARQDISGNRIFDVATRLWGGKWRIPTVAEMRELRDKCTWSWGVESGRQGYVVRSKINGNYIFLPAVGVNYSNRILENNVSGFYWTSTPYPGNHVSAYRLQFSKEAINVNWGSRHEGYYIRAVHK